MNSESRTKEKLLQEYNRLQGLKYEYKFGVCQFDEQAAEQLAHIEGLMIALGCHPHIISL